MKTTKTMTLLCTMLLLATIAQGQDKVMRVHSGGNVVYGINASQVDSVVFSAQPINTYLSKEGRFDMNETEFVTMRLLPEYGFVNSTMNLIIENHSTGVLHFGQPYSLLYFDEESWIEVPIDHHFEDIGYFVEAGGEIDYLRFYISERVFNKPGRYRMVKKIDPYLGPHPFEPNNIFSAFDLHIEIEIK